MTHTPGIALATEIAAQIGTLTLGTNLFHSSLRAPSASVPKDCVFVWLSGGVSPLRVMGEAKEIRTTVVMVQIRDSSFGDGNTLALDIMNGIQAASVATYLDIVAATAGPRMLGQDDLSLHHFGMEYLMTYEETA